MTLEEIRDVRLLSQLLKSRPGVSADELGSGITVNNKPQMGYSFLFGLHRCGLGWRDGLDDQGGCWTIILERLEHEHDLDIGSSTAYCHFDITSSSNSNSIV
jgi:hypothetical protein